MKKISYIKSMFALFCAAFLFLANSTNPPNGRTGAPNPGGGNEQFCAGCHSGNTNGFDGTIDISGIPANVVGNTTYPVTVTITKTAGSSTRAGFQLTILDDDAMPAGSMTNPGTGTTVTTASGREYAEHNSGTMQFGAGNTVAYNFDWTAPNSIGGTNINIYSTTVMGNSNGNTNGDFAFTHYPSYSFTPGSVPLTVQTSATDVLCNGDNNGTVNVTPSGGTGTFSYQWSNNANNATSQMVSNLGAGTYTVTVTSGTDTQIGTAVITEPSAIIVTASEVSGINCNNPTGIATANAVGGTGNISYLWDNNQNVQTASNLSAGMHTVTASDANMCEQTTTVFISSDVTPPNVEAGSGGIITCDVTTLQLNGAGSSIGGNFSYLWTTTNGNIVSDATTLNPTVNLGGFYTLTVTNTSNGCSSLDVVTVTEDNNIPIANAGNTSEINCGNNIITLNGNSSSQGAEFTYLWTTSGGGNILGGATTLSPVIDAAGLYALTVTNTNNGCTATDNVQISADFNIPIVSAIASNEINCVNNTAILDGSGSSQGNNFSYTWTASNGGSISGSSTNITATAASSGLYSLLVVNQNNNCQDETTVIVTSNTLVPNVDAGPNMIITCINSSIVLDGTASDSGNNFTYGWTTSDGNILSGSNTLTPTVNAAGTYTLAIIDNSNGCLNTSSVTVTEDLSLPIVSISTPSILDCQQNDVDLNGSNSSQGSNFIYSWSTTNGNITGATDASTTTADAAGTYCLSIFDTDNGCSIVECVMIEAAEIPTVVIDEAINLECNGFNTGFIAVLASGGDENYSYAWSNSGTNASIQQLEAGQYSVVVTDGNFCEATISATITEPDALVLNITSTNETASNTNDGTALAGISGGTSGYTYNWSNGEQTQEVTGLAPDNYQVTVTDANECEITGEVSISSFDCALSAMVTSTDVLCNNESTGSATVAVSDATNPVTYLWSSGGTDATETNLAAGTYTVTTNDASNCQVILTITITEPAALSMTAATSDVSCNGGNDGSATITAIGGTSPYQYSWSNGGDGTNLSAGTYTVSVFDSFQCETSTSFTITEPDAISAQMSATIVSAEGANDGTATANAAGGTGNYTFLWNDPNAQTTATATGLAVGNYCVVITDGNNCVSEFCVEVTLTGCASLMASVSTTEVSCNNFSDGTATANPSGGSGEYTYNWSSGGNAQIEEGLSAGSYTVSITDTDGCLITETFTITEPVALTVELIEIINIECEGQTSGSATVMGQGGTGNYTYTWSNGGDTGTQTDLAAGDYVVSVSDENLCETTFTVMISAGNDTTPPIALANDITLEASVNTIISAEQINNGSSDNCGIGALTLSQTNFSCDDLGENEVIFVVTDINGNATSTTAIVTIIDTTAPVVFCPTTFIYDCDGTVTYDFSATDNCGDYSVAMQDGTQSGSQFPVGQTDVTIITTDASGNYTECEFTVNVESVFSMTTITTNPSCNGGNDGSVEVETSGGSTPITIDVNGGLPNELAAGTYIVSATDANGCVTSTEITLIDPLALNIIITQIVDEENNTENGAILVDIEGGTGNLSTSWTGPNNFTSEEEDLVNLMGGTYILTITDENGCTLTSEDVIVQHLTSVEEPIWAKGLELYPNPTNDYLMIELPENSINASFELMNIVGQTVLENDFSNSNARLDVQTLASGVYWVKVNIEEEFVLRKVVVE